MQPCRAKADINVTAIQNSASRRRVLVKLSGEALQERGAGNSLSPTVIAGYANEFLGLVQDNWQVAVVLGGGNIVRGRDLVTAGMDRVTADHIGMLGTVMNCLALQDAIESIGMHARVMSALPIHDICEDYIRRRAMRHLDKGRIILLAAGTGNPYFTTDTAACLRAVEIGAALVIKATKVDGIYSGDPGHDTTAARYTHLSYDEVLRQRLGIMDATAIVLCRDNHLPLRVVNMDNKGFLLQAVRGTIGTLVNDAQKPPDTTSSGSSVSSPS